MNCLKEFLYKNKEKTLKKLEFLLNSSREKLYLVLDFDRTITKSKNRFGENVSTWEILSSYLPEKAQKEYKELYNKYRPLEINSRITAREATVWGEKILNLYKENKLKYPDITNDIEKRMPIRPGVKELFNICEEKNIPIIIISAGIKDVIKTWCQKFEIKPTMIISTKLCFDSKRCIAGWEKDSFIHALNKKEKGRQKINVMKKLRPNTVLIGDSVDDASVVDGNENVLRIIIDDQHEDNLLENKAFNNNIFKNFDLIINDKSLNPLVDIIKLF